MIRTLRRALLRNWNRLLGSLSGQRRENDLTEELEAHIQLIAEENIRRGVPREEAYRRARLQFGSVESTKESYRDQRGLPFLDTTLQDSVMRSAGSARVPVSPPSRSSRLLSASGRIQLSSASLTRYY